MQRTELMVGLSAAVNHHFLKYLLSLAQIIHSQQNLEEPQSKTAIHCNKRKSRNNSAVRGRVGVDGHLNHCGSKLKMI
ncbi:unnamed protein product [Lasius platythorax]|uniref:Uncharacterized protein n=1 Tax=Lasius platythorax TaxID=488582 RepID=A0AAV2MYF6_9HYME